MQYTMHRSVFVSGVRKDIILLLKYVEINCVVCLHGFVSGVRKDIILLLKYVERNCMVCLHSFYKFCKAPIFILCIVFGTHSLFISQVLLKL
jgi:hypothetical protein